MSTTKATIEKLNQVRKCAVCGADISDRPHGSKYCSLCAYKRKQGSKKRSHRKSRHKVSHWCAYCGEPFVSTAVNVSICPACASKKNVEAPYVNKPDASPRTKKSSGSKSISCPVSEDTARSTRRRVGNTIVISRGVIPSGAKTTRDPYQQFQALSYDQAAAIYSLRYKGKDN